MRRLRSMGVKASLLFCGLAAGLLLAECFLRLAGVAYPLPYVPDPYIGTRLRPGFAGWFLKEGKAYVQINNAGFRDRDHELLKPADTIRIAVLGDSYAEAVQVSSDDTFWSVLEKSLAASGLFGDKRVEVLNFGVSGHGTAQQLLTLQHYVWDYEPDIIVLAFLSGNDLRNNSKQLEAYRLRPFFELDNEQLVLDDSFLRHQDYLKANSSFVKFKVKAINSSRLLQLVNQWRTNSRRRVQDQQLGFEPGIDDLCFVEPADDQWRNAWEITERLIVQMFEETKQHGAQFVLVTVTNPIQVHPDRELREQFREQLGVGDLLYPERRLESLGQSAGFPVIALARKMGAYADKQQRHWHGFENTTLGSGHWNASGHRLAGKLIAEGIIDHAKSEE